MPLKKNLFEKNPIRFWKNSPKKIIPGSRDFENLSRAVGLPIWNTASDKISVENSDPVNMSELTKYIKLFSHQNLNKHNKYKLK